MSAKLPRDDVREVEQRTKEPLPKPRCERTDGHSCPYGTVDHPPRTNEARKPGYEAIALNACAACGKPTAYRLIVDSHTVKACCEGSPACEGEIVRPRTDSALPLEGMTFTCDGPADDHNPAWPFADGSYPKDALDGVPEELTGCHEIGCGTCPTCAFYMGAAVAFGMVGMGRAIMAGQLAHKAEGLGPDDVKEEDRAIVQDFYRDACHAEWCEYDVMLLEYVAARSRLNGQRRRPEPALTTTPELHPALKEVVDAATSLVVAWDPDGSAEEMRLHNAVHVLWAETDAEQVIREADERVLPRRERTMPDEEVRAIYRDGWNDAIKSVRNLLDSALSPPSSSEPKGGQ